MINEIFFDKFKIENIEHDKNKVLIILKSTALAAKCTCCGAKTTKVHSKYKRQVLDLPILDKYTRLSIITRRFFCINSDCKRKIFSEEFKGFISRYQRLTKRLSKHLINIGLTQSANQAYRIINKFIPVSASSILRLAKNHKINVKYNSEFIGIDDFSFRKGITFGTLICDLTTGKPVDIINSRKLDEVTKHLKLYKNAKIVSRDRSIAYAKAITDALPNATQVADRFHIIHNFLEGICDFLKKYIGKAREVAISRNTIKKYIKIDDIENIRYNNKPTPIYFYKDLIINLLVQKKSYKDILLELRNHGVQYSYSSIAKLAGQLKKEGLPKDIKDKKSYIFTRYNLIKIFWNHYDTTSEVYCILARILDKYPLLDDVFMSIATLRDVLDSKSQERLIEWIDYNSNSQIKEIKGFINGVRKDYTSVANAVIYLESNGILEGNVNRLKYIKRSMFGRASFNLLRNKVLANI